MLTKCICPHQLVMLWSCLGFMELDVSSGAGIAPLRTLLVTLRFPGTWNFRRRPTPGSRTKWITVIGSQRLRTTIRP